jgi:hypothetical protein
MDIFLQERALDIASHITKGNIMELQLATIQDMIDELRRRRVPFVLVATENTNRQVGTEAWVAGQGETQLDVLNMCRLGAKTFRRLHNGSPL